MVAVVWRVSDPDFDVAAFLQEFDLEPDVVWRRGEKEGDRQINTSGFNLSIDQEDTLEGILEDLRTFLTQKRSAFLALQAQGVSSSIDFGFTVGGARHFMSSLRFPPTDLALLAELGITLKVSAYPGSDD